MRRLLQALFCLLLLQPAWARGEIAALERLVPGLQIVTSFAHDYGERITSVTYAGETFTPSEATQRLLPRLDWSHRSDRLTLGVAWVRVFAFHGCEILDASDARLGTAAPPQAELLSSGSFRYTAWAVVMTGRQPGRQRLHRQVEISPAAELQVRELAAPTH